MAAHGVGLAWLPVVLLCLMPIWWLFVTAVIERLNPLARVRARFPGVPSRVPLMPITSARIGAIRYNRVIRIGMSDEGMFLRVVLPFSFTRPLTFIPLAEIRHATPRRRWFSDWVEFTVGDPAITTMVVPASVFAGSQLAAPRATA